MLPIFDLGLGIVRRFVNHKPIFAGDRDHSYDRLAESTNSQIVAVLVTFAVTALLIGLAIALSFTNTRLAVSCLALIFLSLLVAANSLGWLRGAPRAKEETERLQIES